MTAVQAEHRDADAGLPREDARDAPRLGGFSPVGGGPGRRRARGSGRGGSIDIDRRGIETRS